MAALSAGQVERGFVHGGPFGAVRARAFNVGGTVDDDRLRRHGHVPASSRSKLMSLLVAAALWTSRRSYCWPGVEGVLRGSERLCEPRLAIVGSLAPCQGGECDGAGCIAGRHEFLTVEIDHGAVVAFHPHIQTGERGGISDIERVAEIIGRGGLLDSRSNRIDIDRVRSLSLRRGRRSRVPPRPAARRCR